MTSKQIMRIHTAAGVEDIDADRLIVEGDDDSTSSTGGEEEVRRVSIADILSETDPRDRRRRRRASRRFYSRSLREYGPSGPLPATH